MKRKKNERLPVIAARHVSHYGKQCFATHFSSFLKDVCFVWSLWDIKNSWQLRISRETANSSFLYFALHPPRLLLRVFSLSLGLITFTRKWVIKYKHVGNLV